MYSLILSTTESAKYYSMFVQVVVNVKYKHLSSPFFVRASLLVFYGLITQCICEINLTDLGNDPSAMTS